MGKLKIASLTNGFGIVVVLCVLLVGGVGGMALSQLKVGGPLYQHIVLGKDLVADILPPPEYIIESYLEATLALNDPPSAAERGKRLTQLKAEYDDRRAFWIASSLEPGLRDKLVNTSHAQANRFYRELDKSFLPALAAGDMEGARKSYEILSAAYGAHRAVIDQVVAEANAMNSATEDEAGRLDSHYMRLLWTTAAIALALVMVGVMFIGRGVIRPVVQMTAMMQRLAAGDHSVDVPHTSRRDEIGQMAAAIQVFKDNALAADALRRQQEQDRRQAEADKLAALRSMAETVERETRAAVDTVSQRTGQMAEDAAGMARSAQAVSENCQTVAAAAAQALANAQTVASASEELSASIGEIANQIGSARDATGQAVEASDRAESTINHLSDAVIRIGEVTQLINQIANQTNLLALNATIKAARAGEAGKGFAVVANEVKVLATQTAKATGDITTQIAEIQATTALAVQAVRDIAHAIQGVETVSATVAAAIEQQTAATSEIARNVIQTSDAAREVADRIGTVSSEAVTTGHQAGSVSSTSSQVASGVTALGQILIKVVRTATTDVDRRKDPRASIAAPATVMVEDRQWPCQTINLSAGGAELAGTLPSAVPGQEVALTLSGLDMALPARVREVKDGNTHLTFALNARQTSALDAYLSQNGDHERDLAA